MAKLKEWAVRNNESLPESTSKLADDDVLVGMNSQLNTESSDAIGVIYYRPIQDIANNDDLIVFAELFGPKGGGIVAELGGSVYYVVNLQEALSLDDRQRYARGLQPLNQR